MDNSFLIKLRHYNFPEIKNCIDKIDPSVIESYIIHILNIHNESIEDDDLIITLLSKRDIDIYRMSINCCKYKNERVLYHILNNFPIVDIDDILNSCIYNKLWIIVIIVLIIYYIFHLIIYIMEI